MKKFKIFLFLCEINNKALAALKSHLQYIFGLDVEVTSNSVDLNFAYNERRKQYSGEEILKKAEKNKRNPHEKWLIIVDVDLYSDRLNFIFGLANPYSGVAIISLTRLGEQFYGKHENEKLFIERIKKEATHELGHLFFLGHCKDKKCVMRFSNSLYDTDLKSDYFCERCRKILLYNIKKEE